eukprot:291221-Prorocentrum_lima.AAC.1
MEAILVPLRERWRRRGWGVRWRAGRPAGGMADDICRVLCRLRGRPPVDGERPGDPAADVG